jgi:uncharacterized glyoxalase superfamily protein PhnB
VPTVVFDAAPIVSLLNLRLERGTTMQPTVNALDITVADLGAKYAELTAAGVTGLQEPFDAPWGMRYATVADPSGNGIDLYANLPADPTH